MRNTYSFLVILLSIFSSFTFADEFYSGWEGKCFEDKYVIQLYFGWNEEGYAQYKKKIKSTIKECKLGEKVYKILHKPAGYSATGRCGAHDPVFLLIEEDNKLIFEDFAWDCDWSADSYLSKVEIIKGVNKPIVTRVKGDPR
ncbi:hypothetical protein L1D50_08800 [Pseudoalteromonas sp. Isolate6]|uniref:hypothetical protein n=1 Tax=Pseudoalteromonas sp. Isolate6 TaxID=2908527 RepID=UPI001EFDD937|nr:hypothetical protein [Pseudoalteromonas sp. Isolate6]MCG9759206.1 hypothetical protein [Pseudoalteromonas sp. Isolate6]